MIPCVGCARLLRPLEVQSQPGAADGNGEARGWDISFAAFAAAAAVAAAAAAAAAVLTASAFGAVALEAPGRPSCALERPGAVWASPGLVMFTLSCLCNVSSFVSLSVQ